ncbi:MAG: hypothetical protein HQM03_02475 [Magnetococcales bacterium]|nr:hypothetical protein [Magnetococcales bacterium]
MEEEESTQEEQPKPRNKLLLVAAILVGVVLLAGGGWLIGRKMGFLAGGNEAEQVHREPSEVEKRAAEARKIPTVHPFKESPRPEQEERKADPVQIAPVRGPDQAEVSLDQVTVVVAENGERRVRGRLFNHGPRKLTGAEVRIQFLDTNGQVIFSRSVNPLVVSGGLFGDLSEALPVGSGRQFYVLADDTPVGWSGRVDAKLMGLRFGSGQGE